MMSDLVFGQKVTIAQKYYRKCENRVVHTTGFTRGEEWKVWATRGYAKEGVFLGYRTLSNGIRYYEADEGYYFGPEERIKAALVYPGPHLNPVYVPLDAITGD